MEIIRKKPSKDVHPYVPELQESLRKGDISRREFLRYATLLGLSLGSATALAACAQPTPVPPTAGPPTAVPPTAAPAKAIEPTAAPKPTAAPVAAGAIKRGGKLICASRVQKVTHPAQFSWVSASNQLRQVAEYLTYTDKDNITHPYLLDSYKPSDDLKTWTLNLRKGLKHNNGDEFNANDVVFTMSEWFKKDVGSSIAGLMSYMDANGIEKKDDYTVVLHLNRGEIGVPEHLFHYPALMLNSRTFQGDFLKAPHGTGPYTLDTYTVGERVLLKARKDYWQKGADGQPLPYLDQMEFIDMGDDTSAWMAAIKGGQVDYLDLADNVSPDFYNGLKDDPNVTVIGMPTGITRVMRMRVDLDPWKDNRVRQALKLCQNREKILSLAYFGQGVQGGDFHVYPKHPEYCDKPVPKYDPAKAKQLLADAGYPNGLDIKLAVGSGWPDIVAYAQVLKEDAAAAGFRITVDAMPNSQYWDKWTEVDLGVTPWTHRPLGTMILNLAYTADDKGKPVAWNESRWVDDEFSKLLQQANATIDVEKRRQIMCQLEQIQMDRGSVGIAWWMNIWTIYRKNVQAIPGHPTYYMLFNEVWKSA
jgi:peptide/nickel transport system substrate-binding protein